MIAVSRPAAPPAVQMAQAALLAVMLSIWAAAVVVTFFVGQRLHALPLIAATVFPVVLYASKNPRLFMLFGAVGTAFIGLSINFERRVHVGGAPSFSIELVDLFLIPLVVFMIRDRARGLAKGFQLSPVSLWWAGLIVLGVGNLILGPFRLFAGYEVFRMLKCWLLFLVIVNECVREKHFQHAVVALAAGVALNLLIAAAQYAVKGSLGLQALGEASADAVLGANLGVYLQGDVYRVSGLVGHPNLFGAYLAMLLPIFAALVFTDYPARLKLAFVALTIAGMTGLVLTLSRTGWSAYAAAMLCLVLFLYLHPALRNRWTRRKGLMVVGLALVALAASGPVIRRLTASDSGALDFRYELLGVAWNMIKAKPILGVGLNSFSYHIEYAPYGVAKMVELFGPVWPVVHNTFFLVWAEQGSIGLLLFLGLNLHLLWIAWRNTRFGLSSRITMLNVALFGAVVALLVDGFGSFYLRVPGPARVFWVIAGLIVASHYWNVRNLAARSAPIPPGPAGAIPRNGPPYSTAPQEPTCRS